MTRANHLQHSDDNKNKTFSQDEFDDVKKKLEQAPAVPLHVAKSKQVVVNELVDVIVTLQSNGYTLEQIANLMTTDSFSITPATLKNYFSKAKKLATKNTKVVAKKTATATVAITNTAQQPAQQPKTDSAPTPSPVAVKPAVAAPDASQEALTANSRARRTSTSNFVEI